MAGLRGIILEGVGARQIRVFKGSLWLLKCTLLGVFNSKGFVVYEGEQKDGCLCLDA